MNVRGHPSACLLHLYLARGRARLYARGCVFCRYCRYFGCNLFKQKDLYGNKALHESRNRRYLYIEPTDNKRVTR